MADAFTLKLDTSQWQSALRGLGQKGPIRIARAITRTAGSAQVAMARAVASDIGVKVGVAKATMTVTKATPAHLIAQVVCTGPRIPLIDLGAKGPYPSRGKGRGVTAKGKRYPRAFIAQMRSGHRGVFQRSGTSRLPIYELYGASMPHVFTKHAPAGAARAQEQLQKNVAHELEFLLRDVAA